jgi:hypothetical protein
MSEPIFVGYIPHVVEWRIVCRHSQHVLALEPDDFPIPADTHVSLFYDLSNGQHVGQCPDCGKRFYALAESEPPR